MIFPVIVKYTKKGIVETIELADRGQLDELMQSITNDASQVTEYTIFECTRIVERKTEWIGRNP
jgi:hypothetical protein